MGHPRVWHFRTSSPRRELVHGPSVSANGLRDAAMLGPLLCRVVVRRTEAHKVRGIKEQRSVAAVRLAMVNDGGEVRSSHRVAHGAERIGGELDPAQLPPRRRVVPAAILLRGWAAAYFDCSALARSSRATAANGTARLSALSAISSNIRALKYKVIARAD